jgi:hypothetical protein
MSGVSADKIIMASVAAVVLFVLGFAVSDVLLGPSYERFDFLYEDYRLSNCIERFGADEAVALPDLNAATASCYDHLYAQGLLNEFLIRRVNFQTQHVADQMLMWMVIGLTISGVVLAGVQIIGANRVYMASGGKTALPDSEVSLEAGKIYVKSAVTGVVILLISFAFFFVYVAEVYTIKDPPGTDPVEAVTQSATVSEPPAGQGNFVDGGGLGPPPEAEIAPLDLAPVLPITDQ